MKRIRRNLLIGLCLLLILGLSACQKEEQPDINGTSTPTPVPTTEPTVTATSTPMPTATPKPTATHAPSLAEKYQNTSIMEEAKKHGFTFGSTIDAGTISSKARKAFLEAEFESVTATNELKAYSLLDQNASKKSENGMPVMNYATADKIVAYAQEAGLGVRGHVLVWDAYMCDWFFREGYSSDGAYVDGETLKVRVKYYIEEVVTHFETKFPGVVYCWDVVNEAVGDSVSEYMADDSRHVRTMRSGSDNMFYKIMGSDYVEYSFLCAKDTVEKLQAENPKVSIRLFYNDYNSFYAEKRDAIIELIKSINTYAKDEEGNYRILCEGMGMQSYIGGYGQQAGCMNEDDITRIKEAVTLYHNLGVDVHVTEMAVRNYEKSKEAEHAKFYAKLFQAYAELNARETMISNITIWGITDNPSMPKSDYSYKMNGPYCGLFDKYYKRKDAYFAVLEAILDEIEVAELSDSLIPTKYTKLNLKSLGRIEKIEYPTYDYFGDGSAITKSAYVYLPPNYDEKKQYNVLYLMHGIGGNEAEWGMTGSSSKVKLMMDNLIGYGDIEPFIVVTPNGRSSADFANTSADYNSFYVFGKELRNDLIPYIDANYATYAEYNVNGYDLTASRDHRAMAGLSMGGMQTINIGLCECLDIMSWFGAFSAAPTSNTSDVIAKKLEAFPTEYDIHYFYNICGVSDTIALSSAKAAAKNLT